MHDCMLFSLLQEKGGSVFTPCVCLWSTHCLTSSLELMFRLWLDCWLAWVRTTPLRFQCDVKKNIKFIELATYLSFQWTLPMNLLKKNAIKVTISEIWNMGQNKIVIFLFYFCMFDSLLLSDSQNSTKHCIFITLMSLSLLGCRLLHFW